MLCATLTYNTRCAVSAELEDSERCVLQFDRWVIPKEGEILSVDVLGRAGNLVGCCQECAATIGCNLWIYCNGLNSCPIPDVVVERMNSTTLPSQGCMLWNASISSVPGRDALEYLPLDVHSIVSSVVNTFDRNAQLDRFDYYPAQILQGQELKPCNIPGAFVGLNHSAGNQDHCYIFEELETVAQVCKRMENCDGFMYIQPSGSAGYGRLLSGVPKNAPLETRVDPFSTTWIQQYTASSHSVGARIYWTICLAFCLFFMNILYS